LRIALVTETFLPRVDGVTNTLRHVLSYLAKRGHDALMFAPKGAPNRYAGTRIISFDGVPFPFYPDFKLISPTVNLTQYFRDFQPDIVHVVNPITLGLGAIRRAKLMGLPIVASYHTDVPGFARHWRLGLFSKLMERYLRWMHNQAHLNLCPSEHTRAQLEQAGYWRLQVWSRGVDTQLFHPQQRSTVWRKRLTDGHVDATTLLFVGRLGHEKRIDWVRPVLDALPNLRFAIVGDGPARAHLQSVFANSPTTFLGMLHGEDLAHAYASADCFIFPSANETFGNVALEAMASGLPVIAANVGGQTEFCVHGKNALLFDANSKPDLVARVQEMIGRVSFARGLAENGRATALSRNWDSVLDGLIESYETVLAQSAYEYRSYTYALRRSPPPSRSAPAASAARAPRL
jgi:glycosyltransferase involved in cell wall biosynthesis